MNFLISTVGSKFEAKSANILVEDTVVINQLRTADQHLANRKTHEHVYFEKGLSRSRNRAIGHARDEICLISDDDVVFVDNAKSKIVSAFSENPEADIITFQIDTPERAPFKLYPKLAQWHNVRSVMRVSSIEIAFRLSSVKSANLLFDEDFGLGAEYPTGEENIFLRDAIQKGMKVLFVPEVIAFHPIETSGSNFSSDELLRAKGAMFARMFGWLGIFVILLFALRKRRSTERTLGNMLQLMAAGSRGYLSGK